MTTSSRWALALVGSVIVACGGGTDAGDAGPPDAVVADAGVDGGQFACDPSAIINRTPRQLDGTLDGADADFDVTAGSCMDTIAPFGEQALGPDQVIAVRGLSPESDYAVRLVSAEDLAFYIGTGCDGSADGLDQCLLYVDGSTGNIEVGRFTAPGNGEVVLVVDHWEAEAPTDGSFNVEVYPVQCDETDASSCAGTTPICVDYRCASCDDAYDCTSPSSPVCDPVDDRCVPGVNNCDDDDDGEDGDDGPAGARDITPAVGSSASLDGKICNEPTTEYDYYRFDVATNGESYLITLDWTAAGLDLDMEVSDAAGRGFGFSLFEQPETVQLTHLPAGTYYVRVNYSAQAGITAPVDYTITASRGPAVACTGVADCAAEYRNQGFRSICRDGACELRIGDGSLPQGQVCDSSPDCQSGACAAFPYTSEADTRSLCTLSCMTDAECAGLGTDWVCTTYLADNKCVQKCTTDEHCPISLSFLPTSGPWFRLTCTTATGKCSF